MRVGQATRVYEGQLRKVARIVGHLIRPLARGEGSILGIQQLLQAYANELEPWATRTAQRMLLDVEARSRDTWRALSEEISFGLKRELEQTSVGPRLQELMREQVEAIRSIPLEAAERVGRLATQALTSGARSGQIATALLESGDVAKSRAIMIARTATSTAATTLVQARAEAIDSPGYLWRTSRDGAVRPSHRLMEGKFVRWDAPPTIDGYSAHAGQFANCRCFPEVVFDKDPLE